MPHQNQAVRRSLVAAALFTGSAVFACVDGKVSGVDRQREPIGDAALGGYVASQLIIPSPRGTIVLTDSTRGQMQSGTLRFDAQVTPRVSQASAAMASTLDHRLGRQIGRNKVVTKRDSTGVQHTAALVLDPTDSTAPPKFVLRFVNGKPVDAMRMSFQRTEGGWIPVGAEFVVFDTVVGRGRVKAQASFAIRNGRLISSTRTRLQLADVTDVVRKLFSPTVAYAAGDEEGCARCTGLYWSAVALSAAAAAAVAAETAAAVACAAGQAEICFSLGALHEATVGAMAAAATAWALYNACKQNGGGGETMVVPAGADRSRGSARSSPTAQRMEACEDPGPVTGPGSGGGGSNCWTEYWVIEISYDGGASWDVLWEGNVDVCEYAT